MSNKFTGTASLLGQLGGSLLINKGYNDKVESILRGAEFTSIANLMQADTLRSSKESLIGISKFNQEQLQQNLKQQSQALARQRQLIEGSQLASMAANGIDVSSGSALQLQSEVARNFETSLLNLKLESENRRRAEDFTTKSALVDLENRARAAEFSSAASKALAESEASQIRRQGQFGFLNNMLDVAGNVPSLISQFRG